jgi:hypothetical protein
MAVLGGSGTREVGPSGKKLGHWESGYTLEGDIQILPLSLSASLCLSFSLVTVK